MSESLSLPTNLSLILGNLPDGSSVNDTFVWNGTDWITAAATITPSFSDSVFKIYNNADNTKALMFQCSNISAATTRTYTVPNTNGILPSQFHANSIGIGATSYISAADNIFIGATVGLNTTGTQNTVIGSGSFLANTTGFNNAVFGAASLTSNTEGSLNTVIGTQSCQSITTATTNVAIGFASCNTLIDGKDNIVIGYNANVSAGNAENRIVIGNSATGSVNNSIRIGTLTTSHATILGIRGIVTGVDNAIPVLIDSAGQMGTVSSTIRKKRDINDMGIATSNLLSLRPVTFKWKPEISLSEKIQYGLIAEEVLPLIPDLVYLDAEGLPETVAYQLLPIMILNEMIKMNIVVSNHTATLGSLNGIDTLDARITTNTNAITALNTLTTTHTADLISHGNSITALNTLTNTHTADLVTHSDSITTLNTLTTNHTADLISHGNSITALNTLTNTHTADLVTHSNSITALNTLTTTHTADLVTHSNSITALNTLTNTHSGVLAYLALLDTNTSVGKLSFTSNDTGINNTICGSGSLTANISGSNNTVVGAVSSNAIVNGSNNTVIGAASNTNADHSGCIILGANATSTSNNQLVIKSQVAGAIRGTATLVAGTKVVNVPSVTNNTIILLTSQQDGGVIGSVRISSRVAGVSFTISSTSILDSSTIGYFMIEP